MVWKVSSLGFFAIGRVCSDLLRIERALDRVLVRNSLTHGSRFSENIRALCGDALKLEQDGQRARAWSLSRVCLSLRLVGGGAKGRLQSSIETIDRFSEEEMPLTAHVRLSVFER